MDNKGPRERLHHRQQHKCVCRYCSVEFMGKRRGVDVCEAEGCQRQKETDRAKAKYQRRLQRERDALEAM